MDMRGVDNSLCRPHLSGHHQVADVLHHALLLGLAASDLPLPLAFHPMRLLEAGALSADLVHAARTSGSLARILIL